MRPFSARLVAGGFAFLMLAACGGGDDGNDPGGGGGSGPFTAVVEGEAWSADELTITAQTVPAVPGGFVLTGTQVSNSSDVRTISLSLYNIRGTGTYALGVLANVIGGIGSYGESVSGTGAGFSTPLTGSAGTVTLTVLTATRIAGTFAFEATDNAAATRSITEGQFDVPLASGGALPSVPDNAGGRLTGTVGGTPYNASLVAVTQSGAAGPAFSTSNDAYAVTISLGGVTAPGSYAITEQTAAAGRYVVVNQTSGPAPRPAWGTGTGTTATVEVTNLTATRVRGTFTGTLGRQGGGAPVAVSGDFDVGLP